MHFLDQSFNLRDAVFERIVLRLENVVLRLQLLDGLNRQQRQFAVIDRFESILARNDDLRQYLLDVLRDQAVGLRLAEMTVWKFGRAPVEVHWLQRGELFENGTERP